MIDNRKYTAHSTAKPSASQTDYHRGLGHVFYLIGAVCICIVLSAGIMFGGNALTADKESINAAVIDTSTPFQPITNTPQPTVTPWDTHTPYPTYTHTPAPPTGTQKPNVIYQKLEVTRLVTIIVTPSPEPKTSTPSVTPTLPLVIQEMNQKIEHRMRWREISVKLAEFILSPFMVGFALVCGASWLIYRKFKALVAVKIEAHDEPREAEPEYFTDASPVSGVTKSELRQIRLLLAQGIEPTNIQSKVYGYSGGSGPNSAQQKVNRAIEYLTTPLEIRWTGTEHNYQSSSSQ